MAATTGTFALSLWKHPLAPGSRPSKVLSLPGAHTAPPSSLRFSRPRPSEVITTAEDGACKVHDITQRATVARLSCPAPPFAATPVDESGLVLAVGYGRRVGLWDRRLAGLPQLSSSSPPPPPQRQQASGIVTDVAAVVGLPLLFSSSVDGTVKVLEIWALRVCVLGEDGRRAGLGCVWRMERVLPTSATSHPLFYSSIHPSIHPTSPHHTSLMCSSIHPSIHWSIKAWDLRRGLDQSAVTLSFQPEDVVRAIPPLSFFPAPLALPVCLFPARRETCVGLYGRRSMYQPKDPPPFTCHT